MKSYHTLFYLASLLSVAVSGFICFILCASDIFLLTPSDRGAAFHCTVSPLSVYALRCGWASEFLPVRHLLILEFVTHGVSGSCWDRAVGTELQGRMHGEPEGRGFALACHAMMLQLRGTLRYSKLFRAHYFVQSEIPVGAGSSFVRMSPILAEAGQVAD